MPALAERLFARVADKQHLEQDQTAPATSGNLFKPIQEGTGVYGGWGSKTSSKRRLLFAGLAGMIPLFLAWRRLQGNRQKKGLLV